MHKVFLAAVITIFGAFQLHAQDDSLEEKIYLSDNTEIDLAGNFTAIITVSPNALSELVLTAPTNGKVSDFVRETSLSVLSISLPSEAGKTPGYAAKITVPTLEMLNLSANVRVIMTGDKVYDEMSIKVKSKASLTITLMELEGFNVHASSEGELKASGSCETLNLDASSAASIDMSQMECWNAYADVSSGAIVKMNVKDTLNLEASSGADVEVTGRIIIEDAAVIELSSGAEFSNPK